MDTQTHIETCLPKGVLRPLGKETILEALDSIKPGEAVIYHQGTLAADRRGLGWHKDVEAIAQHAYSLGKRCQMHLVQYRVSPLQDNRFYYVAIGQERRYRHSLR